MTKCLVCECDKEGEYMATFAKKIDIYYCDKHKFLFNFIFANKKINIIE